MYQSRKEPHFFPENEGLPYEDILKVSKALDDKQFKRMYAKGYLAGVYDQFSKHPKVNSLHDSEVSHNIKKFMVRSIGQEQELKQELKTIYEKSPIDMNVPRNLRFTSDKFNSSMYSYRNAFRKNHAVHGEYNSQLESLENKKLLKGIYNLNVKEHRTDGKIQVLDEIIKN